MIPAEGTEMDRPHLELLADGATVKTTGGNSSPVTTTSTVGDAAEANVFVVAEDAFGG